MKILPTTEMIVRLLANEPTEFRSDGKYGPLYETLWRMNVGDPDRLSGFGPSEYSVLIVRLPAQDKRVLMREFQRTVVNMRLGELVLKASMGIEKREREEAERQNLASQQSVYSSGQRLGKGTAMQAMAQSYGSNLSISGAYNQTITQEMVDDFAQRQQRAMQNSNVWFDETKKHSWIDDVQNIFKPKKVK